MLTFNLFYQDKLLLQLYHIHKICHAFSSLPAFQSTIRLKDFLFHVLIKPQIFYIFYSSVLINKNRNYTCAKMEVRLFVSMIVFLHICEAIYGNGVPTVIGQRLIIHNRPCEAHILRVRIRLAVLWAKEILKTFKVRKIKLSISHHQ